MAIIVIGAQTSGAGKTGVVCGLIAAMPERRWTAIKVTQCSHQADTQQSTKAGKPCDCGLDGQTFAFSEEHDRAMRTDSSRYLAAGAARSLWVRTLPGHLEEAMPRIREEISCAENVILESNSVLEFLSPDIYALVVSPCIADFKPSARRYLSRTDAILMAEPPPGSNTVRPAWLDQLAPQLARVAQFAITGTQLAPREWMEFVRERI